MNQKHIEYVAIINSNWYRDKLQLLLMFFIWFQKYPKISKNILIILKHRGYLVYQLLFTLSHIYKFENLKSLKLILPLFPHCGEYYASIKFRENNGLHALTDISIEFKSLPDRNVGFRNATRSGPKTNYPVVMDEICSRMIERCPNIQNYVLWFPRRRQNPHLSCVNEDTL